MGKKCSLVMRIIPFLVLIGSGAPFALEDGWILASAVEYTRSSEGD